MDPLVSQLLNGASLSVILTPDPSIQKYFPDMVETFNLRHVVISGDQFIGKTDHAHAIHHEFKPYDLNFRTSYAYSNYAKIVINSSYSEKTCRYYHASRYLDVKFVTLDDYEIVWDSEKDKKTQTAEHAILAGRKIKIGMLDQDDIWNIHPVHMPSFYKDKNFLELFTVQGAMPLFFRETESVINLETTLVEKFKELETQSKGQIDRVSVLTPQIDDAEFFSTYYTIRSDGTFLRGRIAIKQEEPESYKALRVYASK
jgi:hypothetical protein